MKSFCHVEAIGDAKGNPVKDSNGHPLVMTPNPRVELSNTYLMAWYVMHYPLLMISVSTSSYTTESNEDTFKPDTISESFHHSSQSLNV